MPLSRLRRRAAAGTLCRCFNFPVLAILVALSFLVVHDPKLTQIERIACLLRHPQHPQTLRPLPAAAAEAQWTGSAGADAAREPAAQAAAAAPAAGAAQASSAPKPVVHQTVGSLDLLTPQQRTWRDSWKRLGFEIVTADDAAARQDVERFAETVGDADVLRVYDALETSVQRSDVWRYAILWLDGGVYADIDVAASPPMATLAATDAAVVFSESLPVFEWLPARVARGVGVAARGLGLTDLARLPQRRNCLMIAPPQHPLMRRTLARIVAKFDADADAATTPPPEPTRTLELTGPGIFTDALEELLAEAEAATATAASLKLRFVSRIDGHHYFVHEAQGSWKTYLGGAEAHALKPHERMLRRAVLLLQSAALALYYLCSLRHRRRADAGAGCGPKSRRSLLMRIVDAAAAPAAMLAARFVSALPPKASAYAADADADGRRSCGHRPPRLARWWRQALRPTAGSCVGASCGSGGGGGVGIGIGGGGAGGGDGGVGGCVVLESIGVDGFGHAPGRLPPLGEACGAECGGSCVKASTETCQRCTHCE